MRFQITYSGRHFAAECRVQHGPQRWSRWRLCAWSVVDTNLATTPRGVQGYNVWLYTRWGAAVWHVRLDRRPREGAGVLE